MLWQTIGIIVAVVLALVLAYLVFNKSPKAYYRRARSLHHKGEEAYEMGDHELSEEYYAKANEFRMRAKELE